MRFFGSIVLKFTEFIRNLFLGKLRKLGNSSIPSKGDLLPDTDHILRYVGGRHIDKNDDGSPFITGGGFIARPAEDNKPSYNWIDYFDGGLEEQVQQIRNLARIKYGATAKLVKLNIGGVCSYVKQNTVDSRIVTVIYDPLDAEGEKLADPSHSLMTNIPDENDPEGELVGDLISECILDIFPPKATS